MDWLINHQDIATLIFSAVVALSTVIYALLTAHLVLETKRMRHAQTEPRIVAFVEPRKEFANFAHLYIENIGMGPAFDISFVFKSDPDDQGARLLTADFSKTKFFERGVEYLGPGQKLQSGYTSFPDGYEKKICAVLKIAVKYKSANRRAHTELFSIDISQFEGAGSLGTPDLFSIAQSLKNIDGGFKHIANGHKRMKVDNYSQDDRNREQRDWEEQRKLHSGEGTLSKSANLDWSKGLHARSAKSCIQNRKETVKK